MHQCSFMNVQPMQRSPFYISEKEKALMKKKKKQKNKQKLVYRGEVYYADLQPVVGSEQGGMRPVLIIQNDIGNQHSPTVIAAAITSRKNKPRLPTHVWIGNLPGSWSDSIVLTEQVRTIDKSRLEERITKLNKKKMKRVDQALAISFGIKPILTKNDHITMEEHK